MIVRPQGDIDVKMAVKCRFGYSIFLTIVYFKVLGLVDKPRKQEFLFSFHLRTGFLFFYLRETGLLLSIWVRGQLLFRDSRKDNLQTTRLVSRSLARRRDLCRLATPLWSSGLPQNRFRAQYEDQHSSGYVTVPPRPINFFGKFCRALIGSSHCRVAPG